MKIHMFNKWFSFFKKSKYYSTLQKLDLITMLEIKHVFSSDMTILSVNPVYSKINTYNSRIKYFINCLKSDTNISTNLLSTTSEEVNLISFFTDENKNLLNINNNLNIFIQYSKELINLIEIIDKKESRTFNENKNYNHCNIIINNIDLVITELTKYLKK